MNKVIGGVRALLLCVLVACSVAAPSQVQAADPDRAQKLQSALDAFCEKWMSFLAQREKDNKEKIAWRAIPEGVEGEFVGYDSKYKCKLSELKPETKVPVGTIKYLEFKYRHKGASSSAALANKPKIIEATEVTEIFRYSKTKWVY